MSGGRSNRWRWDGIMTGFAWPGRGRHRNGRGRPRQGARARGALAALFLSAGGSLAQSVVPDVATYDDCLAAVDRDPQTGLAAAQAWRDLGGGYAAGHCVVLALVATGSNRIAAQRLEDMASGFATTEQATAAELMGQAAALWVLAREEERALAALERAIGWKDDVAALYLDRAHILAGQNRFAQAGTDVDRALALDDLSADAYALRAMIGRQTGDLAAAEADLVAALALDPDQPQALMERAAARAAAGDMDGARADLNRVIAADPENPVAEDARRMLEKMDVRTE